VYLGTSHGKILIIDVHNLSQLDEVTVVPAQEKLNYIVVRPVREAYT
jgi:hypothetical protein